MSEDKEYEEFVHCTFLNPEVKIFKTIIGYVCVGLILYGMFMLTGSIGTKYVDKINAVGMDDLQPGQSVNYNNIKLESRDYDVARSKISSKPEIYIWDFLHKGGYDYIQVFADGKEVTAPIAVQPKPVKISLPEEFEELSIKGVHDCDGNGIPYALSFVSYNSAYLNTVDVDGQNTYKKVVFDIQLVDTKDESNSGDGDVSIYNGLDD